MYWHNLLVATDQWVNTLLGGYPDETLSSHAYRSRQTAKFWGLMYNIINRLMGDPNHCYQAYHKEIDLPHEYEGSWDSKYR